MYVIWCIKALFSHSSVAIWFNIAYSTILSLKRCAMRIYHQKSEKQTHAHWSKILLLIKTAIQSMSRYFAWFLSSSFKMEWNSSKISALSFSLSLSLLLLFIIVPTFFILHFCFYILKLMFSNHVQCNHAHPIILNHASIHTRISRSIKSNHS